MEISDYLNLSKEEKQKRKEQWEKREKQKAEGKDPNLIKVTDRALKAIFLLKNDFDSGKGTLTSIEKDTLCAIVSERCSSDFYFFAKNILGFDLLTEQTHKKWADDLLLSIKNGKKRVMRLKPRATFKCLKKGTKLIPFGIDEKYNIKPTILRNQKDFFDEGIKVTLKSGRDFICTKDHPLKTILGWEEPRIGMRIAIQRTLPSQYVQGDIHKEYMLGVLLGDGCLRRSTPRISNPDYEVRKRIEKTGCSFGHEKGIEYNIKGIFKWIKDLGLGGASSHTKFIPKEYEGSPHLLRGLFDTDAHVSKRDACIVYVTVSEKLAEDVVRNLHYFGIVARKKRYEYPVSEKSPAINAFQITITTNCIERYYNHIGFEIKRKQKRLKKIVNGIKNGSYGVHSNIDTIPSEWKELIDWKKNEKRDLRSAGIRIDNHYGTLRKKMRDVANFTDRHEIHNIANADIFWDEILTIEDMGQVEFSAIGSDIENYISEDGVIHHNTSLYGVSFILWLWGCIDPQIRIFYTSANALLLNEVSDSLDRFIGSTKGHTLFSSIFNIVKDEVAKNTSDVFNIKGRAGKGFSLILRTAGGSTVGIHPNIIIVDDALDQNDRESEATRQQKIRWFDSLAPLIVPFFSSRHDFMFETIYYIGTRWHMKDLCNHIFEKNKKLPENLKWDIEVESIYNKEGKTNYPEFISDEKIAGIRAGISDEYFSCQYVNSPLADGMQTFDIKKLKFVRMEQINLNQGQLLCVFDPSKGKSSNDYPAVWWVHYHDDILTFFDAIDQKVEISLMVHYIASKNKFYGCRTLLFEDNNAFLLEDALIKAHSKINWHIQIETVHHGSATNKHERIISIQPELYSGHVQFMDDYEDRYPEAMNQIVFYPVYGHDDFPDAAQMGIEFFKQPHFKFIRYEEML